MLQRLKDQLKTLQNDQRKTSEQMWQITGAIKVIEFLIKEEEASQSPTTEAVLNNGSGEKL